MSQSILQAENISVHRKNGPLLSFPDLTINAAQSVLLLGPSGSGKTTWLSVLAGLLPPDKGSVQIDSKDFYSLSPARRDRLRGRDFGFVFQTLHLIPSLTLRQNIALAADMAKVPLDEIRLTHLLSVLKIEDKAFRKPEALSQGEQQRAAIARAVLLRPKIIIADEPTSALDDENADGVMDLLVAQAKETGASLLIATHDHRIKDRFEKVITLEHQAKGSAV